MGEGIMKLSMSVLEPNRGQIEGLPRNPRKWDKEELERLKRSMEETPELVDARGCVVKRHGEKYVILGGNMRYAAAKALGWKEIACHELPEDMDVEELRAIVIKDNGSFGSWDWDELANSWDDVDLVASGVLKSWAGSKEEEVKEGEKKTGETRKCEERERIIITFPEDMRGELEDILGRKLDPEKIIVKAEELWKDTEDCE